MPEPVVIEASQIGWAPGEWPEHFWRDTLRLVRESEVRHDGELVAVVYRGDDGSTVEVLND